MQPVHHQPPVISLYDRSDTHPGSNASVPSYQRIAVIQETTPDVACCNRQKSANFVCPAHLCLTIPPGSNADTSKNGDKNGEAGSVAEAREGQTGRADRFYSGCLGYAQERIGEYESARLGAVSNDTDGTPGRDHPDSRGTAAGDTSGSPAEATGATRAEVAHLLFLALTPDFYGDLTNARSVRPLCLYTVQSVCDDLELDLPPEVESAFLSQLMDVAHEAIEARWEAE